MLRRYIRRIQRFQEVVEESIRNICHQYWRGGEDGGNIKVTCDSDIKVREDVEKLVKHHLHILIKMKRRLKHMMDVSDKYFLADKTDIEDIIENNTDRDLSFFEKDLQNQRMSISGS